MNDTEVVYEDDTISYDSGVGEIDTTEESFLTKAGRFVFFGFLALFPLWFLPTYIAPVDLNKAFFGAMALVLAFMFTLGGILQEGRLRTVRSRVQPLFLSFLLVWLLASLFSISPNLSLIGFGIEPSTFAAMFVGGLALFLSPLVLRSKNHFILAIFFLSFAFVLSALYFVVQSVLGIDVLRSWDFVRDRAFHPFGLWNTLAVFLGAATLFFMPLVGNKSSWFLRLSPLWFLMSLVGVIVANFSFVWIGVAIVTLFFVALQLSRREQRSRLFAIALSLLMLSVLLFLLRSDLEAFFAGTFESFGRPQEAILGNNATLEVAKKALSEKPLLGSGPNTFGLLWERYKDSEFNRTILWQVRFNAGSSTFLTMAVEGGLIAAFLFILLVLLYLIQGIHGLSRVSNEPEFIYSSFATGLFLIIMWFLYPLNTALIVLTFLMMGFTVVALAQAGVIEARDVYLFENRERGFVTSLVVIFLLVGGVGALYFGATRYLGAIAFGRGVNEFNTTGALNASQIHIRRAIELDASQDRYYRTVAQLEYLKIQRLLQNQDMKPEERSELFRVAYNEARRNAQLAIEKGPEDSANHRMLGQIYEVAIPVDGSVAKLAEESYAKAAALSPLDPSVLVDQARVHLAVADIALIRGGGSSSRAVATAERAKAIDFLEKATELKPDYTQAHFTLSQLYGAENRLNEAIERAQATAELVPNNIGVLFQLGLLYYRKDDIDRAQVVFERAVEINKNYSNARYFLGLIYDKKGNAARALEQFREIAALNPDNEEVKRVLAALESGKKAEDALSEPPPEERPEPPVGDEKKNDSAPKTQ